MVLLCTSYKSSNIILNCNLVRPPTLKDLEHPDKKLNSLGIISIPPKNPNLQERTSPPWESFNHPRKA